MAQETFNILIQGEPKGSLKYTVHTKKNYFHILTMKEGQAI